MQAHPPKATSRTVRRPRLLATAAGLLYACFALVNARADDTEIFFNQNVSSVPANVLFVLDTSGSMNDTVTTQIDYDPSKTYTADKCSSLAANSYYFSSRGTPTCASTSYLPTSLFKCKSMLAGLAASGFVTDSFVQWGSTSSSKTKTNTTTGVATTTNTQTYRWQNKLATTNTTGQVECKLDSGVDGDGVDNTKLFATTDGFSITTTTVNPPGTVTVAGSVTGGQLTGVWDAAKNYFKSATGTAYTIYSTNYMNWLFDSTQTSTRSKMYTMESAASSLIASLSGVNVGLARYDQKGSGGMIMAPIGDLSVGTNRQDRINLVNSWAPTGSTPLSETYYEAYQYFSGGAVVYGNNSTSSSCTTWSSVDYTCTKSTTFSAPSVPGSRVGGTAASKTYDSPADYSCRKNFIVYLTDGLPNEKDQADAAIQGLPNFATLGGACDAKPFAGANGGLCTAALARYMYNADLRNDIAKVQNVTSYFIGFGADFKSNGAPTVAFNYLQAAAAAGGGQAYTADSLAGLTDAFNQILAQVIKVNTTFTSPAVAVNAFNRTQTLNDLYVSVFSPKVDYHWPGNVKKYRLSGGQIVDSLGNPAVDAGTGFIRDGTQSYWSSTADGGEVSLGGAASKLPDASKRTVLTTNAPGTGTWPSLINLSDSSLTSADFVLGATDPLQPDLVNWAYGQDVQDEVAPAGTSDSRHEMGDPIHTQPVVVIYGKNGNGTDNTVIYAPTNDGYLHALDGSADKNGADVSSSGVELWSYVPYEMLPHLKDLYANDPTSIKHYGLDGPITVLKYDANGDGTVDPGDRVVLYFGTGRNADVSAYYALEVTDPKKPALLWKIDASNLPSLGQAWSTPQILRVNINGAGQNSQHLALVMAGGYDASEDNRTYYATDAVGKGVYIVDALSGALLWHAGQTGGDLNIAKMDHAIPAPVAIMDLDGDGYTDRLYVGDMAAQVFRFDLANGNPAASFATGGVIASLGTHDDLLVHPAADQRRFYGTPNLSLEASASAGFLNVAIGSGYRGHPLDSTIHDRFYSIRDYDALTRQPQSFFDNYKPIRDSLNGQLLQPGARLVDITTVAKPILPDGSAGWQLDMNTHNDWSAGEKVLSPARTFNGSVIFTTYSPNTTPAIDPCSGVGAGTNRVYLVDVLSGAPAVDRNKDGTLTADERSQDLRQGGIAPEVAFLFPPADTTTGSGPCTGASCSGATGGPGQTPMTCTAALELINACANLNRMRKTYWREGAAN